MDKIKLNEFYNNRIYSQSGQDAFVISYFNNKKNGVFIDIGAADGIKLSNTYYLEKELNWTGICFEPNPITFKNLDENRNCIKIMAGVSDKKSIEKFTIANFLSGITKYYDPRHVKRIEETKQKKDEIEVQCLLLCDVLREYNIFNIDYLDIDTEGNEFEIIKTIDFDKFDIKLITIENNYNNKDQTNFVISKGYELVGKLGGDEIFIKKTPPKYKTNKNK